MARTAVTVEKMVPTGLEATYTSAIDDASDKTITIQTGRTVAGLAVADQDIVVTAGEERFIGPFDANLYNQPSDTGFVYVDYSAITSVSIAVVRMS